MSVKIPFMRKEILSNLIAFSVISTLLLASPILPLSNSLSQPAQAQTIMTFKTSRQALGVLKGQSATLTFEAHGTASSSDSHSAKITSAIFQIQYAREESVAYSGRITGGDFANNTSGEFLVTRADVDQGPPSYFTIGADCSTSEDNHIYVDPVDLRDPIGSLDFQGPVECSLTGGAGDTIFSITGTTPTQDSDSDGIPDSSDGCAHNSNHRCFEEGYTGTTTQQQPSSSSSRGAGNQAKG